MSISYSWYYDMKIKVLVTGIGIISSAGKDPEECWENLIKGESMAQPDSRLEGLDISWSCPIKEFTPSKYLRKSLIWRSDPFIQYALYAVKQALEDSKLDLNNPDYRVGIVIGNSLGGITSLELLNTRAEKEGIGSIGSVYLLSTMGSMAQGNIAIEFGIKGVTYQINTACASGGDAIGIGKMLIETNVCDIVLAGGSEAPITPLVVSSFSKIGALSKNKNLNFSSRPFDGERDGFVISEGAAFLVLEKETTALKRKAKIYASLTGYGSANDAYHITSPSPEGQGLSNAINLALKDSSLKPEDIDCINAHGTSTPMNDLIESNVIYSIFNKKPYITSTKGVTGHSLAASGALEAVFSVLKIHKCEIPPVAGLKNIDEEIKTNIITKPLKSPKIKHVLSSSLGFGGHNAALIFSKYD
ncbi:beta-ketoacyl-[acyl-carrier-protein] synthase family protein [Salmonella enterica]|uniref:Beta-ketoacyl-[acyl-carrier-protein] synthase family protein n=1 Tax=Salmonella enterica TaxID=28901 RepID=A0A402WA49_SALER|nr:beta-ketoacyl-[acyl-carrier-protein] synthase family protein [Salmonella enterica]EAW1164777.1 beta-ketoacyl-[acyl-carrier-protein] synthase family protein [Salmonella enterica subsp. enterica]EBX1769818.1 beta-ketoacyl-[acyl-carrier-protein] synthase family protein [Salmonella enterica subsp. enterica serovar Poona]EAS2064035.1 beta-ketoacyl-[acyl-carrier-protein] synthase family protein [Salmonella enterica]EAS2070719.1 beta-ketoacyl-[acyl-carrier-protein] synthase family protein [Salmonel